MRKHFLFIFIVSVLLSLYPTVYYWAFEREFLALAVRWIPLNFAFLFYTGLALSIWQFDTKFKEFKFDFVGNVKWVLLFGAFATVTISVIFPLLGLLVLGLEPEREILVRDDIYEKYKYWFVLEILFKTYLVSCVVGALFRFSNRRKPTSKKVDQSSGTGK